jgi:hypothetical protein
MTHHQIKRMAKIYALLIVYNSLGNGAMSDFFSEEDLETFHDEIRAIVDKTIPRIKEDKEILALGSLDGVIKYVDPNAKEIEDEILNELL